MNLWKAISCSTLRSFSIVIALLAIIGSIISSKPNLTLSGLLSAGMTARSNSINRNLYLLSLGGAACSGIGGQDGPESTVARRNKRNWFRLW